MSTHAREMNRYGASVTFTGLTVGAALAEVAVLPRVNRPSGVTIQVKNTDASVALTAFALKARAPGATDWVTILSGAQWGSTTIEKVDTGDSALATLAAGAVALVGLRINTPMELALWASGDGAELSIWATIAANE